MKEMVRKAWEMFTEKEKYDLYYLEDIKSEEDFYDLLEPDWEIDEWKNAEEIYKALKKELLPKLRY